MNTQNLEAIFEKGTFHPLTAFKFPIPEGQKVQVSVETTSLQDDLSPDDILKLATHVYEGLSEQEIDEVEQIALKSRSFFEDKEY